MILSYAKLAAGVAVVGAVVALGFIVKGWKDDAAQLELVRADLEQARADLALRDQQFQDAQEASRGYQTELATLRIAAARSPAPVVRLRQSAGVPERGPLPESRPGPDAAAPGPGSVPPATGGDHREGPDIGPELAALADRADELSAQVRGLQTFAGKCSRGGEVTSIDGAPVVLPLPPLEPRSPNPWDRLQPRHANLPVPTR